MTNSVSGYKEDMEMIYKHTLPSPQNNDFFCCAETYIDDESFSLALNFSGLKYVPLAVGSDTGRSCSTGKSVLKSVE